MRARAIIPPAVRLRIERKLIATSPEASVKSVILHWEQRYSAFILMAAHDNASWKNGYTAVTIPASEAIKMELFISEKTAAIIRQLQATAEPSRRTRLVARKMRTADALRAMLAPKQPVFAVSSLAWHRVPGVLPDACTTVLVSLTKEESEPIWLGYYEDEIWRSIDGAPFAGQVYAWADIPEAPPAPLAEKGGRS